MIRIGIAGGPGAGKSSLARQITTELYNKRNLNAHYVTEFARDHINKAIQYGKGGFVPSLGDQLLIFDKQIERENIIPESTSITYVISDSPLFLPIIFAHNIAKMESYQDRSIYLHLYNTFLTNYLKRYDFVFLLQRQKDFRKDGTRHETAQEADEIGRQIHSFLNFHKIPFHYIMAENDEIRIKEVLKIMEIK